jgi:hypothetical protein
MQVSSDGAHEECSHGLGIAVFGGKEGFKNLHAGLHGASGDENFRDVEDIVFEVFSNDAHAGDESFCKDLLKMPAFGKGVLGHLFDFFGFALIEALIHQGVVNHVGSG